MDVLIRPRGPYSLRLSTRLPAEGVLRVGGALVSQAPDGRVHVRAPDAQTVERVRWRLALDDDHSQFLRRFAGDPLLGRALFELRGLRPARLETVAHAFLRALCGQLIEASRAHRLERTIVRAVGGRVTSASLGRFSPAELRRLGLAAERAATLVRVCRALDLERLRSVPVEAAAARLRRERGIGPWSVGVVALEGLGSWRYGLAGDLGLIKLLSAARGRRVEAWESEELLAGYGEWQGLASVYLLKGFARGLVPLRAAA